MARRRVRIDHTDKPFAREPIEPTESIEEAMARFRARMTKEPERTVAPASQDQTASPALKRIIRTRGFNLQLPEDEGDIL